MEKFVFKPHGVCSKSMEFEVEDHIIKHVNIIGGCAGNLLGISKIIEGMNVENVIKKFEGTPCGAKSTSCPDQIAKALKEKFEI